MNALRVGFFLALRQLKRSSPWTTLLIIFIMTLTFLNLVVVGGILVGLPVGALDSYNQQYSGDILLRSLPTKTYIEQSETILKTIRTFPEVTAVSGRYVGRGVVEANYKTAIGPNQEPDSVNVQLTGIDPAAEESVADLGARMLEGEMLKEGEEGYVVIGKNLLAQYTLGASIVSATTLKNVTPGSKVRLIVNGNTAEFTVKGVLGSKVSDVSTRVFLSDGELRKMLGRTDRNVGEIAVRLQSHDQAIHVRDDLRALGFAELARVETARESQGTFLDDIEKTFVILSQVIGGVGLVVASITVFIVIFINAVTRRKYIGILKGIGISGTAIELSYVFQSICYAMIGSAIGLVIVFFLIAPYFVTHPIDFPFADGVLLAPLWETVGKAGMLIGVTIIAGYIPARLIISRNTLDAILGR